MNGKKGVRMLLHFQATHLVHRRGCIVGQGDCDDDVLKVKGGRGLVLNVDVRLPA